MATNNLNRRSRKLAFQSLEERTLMAGDVTVAVNVSSGDLKISGDANAHDVAVIQTMQQGAPVAGSYFVTGRNGTTINGSSGRTFTGVTHDFVIGLAGSGNRLTIGTSESDPNPGYNISLPHDLKINMGAWLNPLDPAVRNWLDLEGIIVSHDTTINLGTVLGTVHTYSGLFGHNVTITGGDYDSMEMGHATVMNDLKIVTGGGTAFVGLYSMSVFHDVLIQTGDSPDVVEIDHLNVKRDLEVLTGGGSDSVSITNSKIVDTLFANLGAGDDTLKMSNTSGSTAVLDHLDLLSESNVNFKSLPLLNFGI